MNYFKSRFLHNRDHISINPLHTAENVLREYRQRRRHRVDLDSLLPLLSDESSSHDSTRTSSPQNTPKQSSSERSRSSSPAKPTVQKKTSFRRRRNDSGEENPFLKRRLEEEDYAEAEVPPTKDTCDAKSVLTATADTTNKNVNEEDEEDPLGFIQIKSAAQWMAVSKRISWNFESKLEDSEIECHHTFKIPKKLPDIPQTQLSEAAVQDYDKINYDIYCPEDDGQTPDFKPTKVQQLRLICWKIKPWKQPKMGFGHNKLFSSIFGAPWGVDCDEVYPGLFIGDKASASNVAFLKKYGITHVLNAAEGQEEGLVDLSADHYDDTGITYLGFPLWDAPGCNLTPYFGIAADYIASAIDRQGGKVMVNCQMGVSRSASCAIAYLMIHQELTSLEALTMIRKSRDCRPNDGFLSQLINLDNELRKERECNVPRQLRLSTIDDKYRLPQSWHTEFWIPGEVTEEELGFPIVPMGQSFMSLKLSSSTSVSRRSTSNKSSRTSSKRNSFRKPLSRCSSTKRSRPTSICIASSIESDWEWVWETDDEDELVENKLEQVSEIIGKSEEKWRQLDKLSTRTSSRCSSFYNNGKLTAQAGVEESDPLAMVKVASAKQWKQISRKLTINFDDLDLTDDKASSNENAEKKSIPQAPFREDDLPENLSEKPPLNAAPKTPFEEAMLEALSNSIQPVEDKSSTLHSRLTVPDSFKPTTVPELRRICWQIKPWEQPARKTFAERQLFTSMLGSPWGVDADEVFPRILVGDQAAARNIAFLKRYGITHVLNAAEGPWEEHCVDLSQDHYAGSGITYLGLPLFDHTDVKILPYLGVAADFIKNAMESGKKCLVNCQMGVSRSCSSAMAYLMIYEEMAAVDILRTFRRRRDVRPNDYFMEQIVELDNDLRKAREYGIPRSIKLPSFEELDSLPKPWHFEFWNEVPEDEDLPFTLTHMVQQPAFYEKHDNTFGIPKACSKRASMVSNASSEWEWEYYDETEDEESVEE